MGDQLAGDDPQQGGLAGTVGADQGDLGPLAHAEGHVVEQHPAVGQLEAHPGNVHVTHEASFSAPEAFGASRFAGRLPAQHLRERHGAVDGS